MNKFWVVFWHTFLSKLKTKSFIITTAVMLVLILAVTNIQQILDKFDSGGKDTVGVMDETGQWAGTFKQAAEAENEDLEIRILKDEKSAEKLVSEEELTGFLIIQEDESGLPQGEYKANELTDTEISSNLSTVLNQLKWQLAKEKLDLTDEQLQALNAPAAFKVSALDANAKTEEDLSKARGLVYVLLFAMYFSVLMYSSMIATDTAVEKSSRVMEILISSISPIQQLFAKILGLSLLSLGQMVLFLGAGYLSVKKNMSGDSEIFEYLGFSDTKLSTIIYALVFLVLGYLLYAVLAACLGSIVSRVEDVQQMIMPVTLLVVIAFIIAASGLSDPAAGYVTVTSFIPFFTPMIMFLRVGMLDIPFWQTGLSIVILIVFIGLLAVIGARVYRGGVLLYGGSKSLKDLKKAMQISKNA